MRSMLEKRLRDIKHSLKGVQLVGGEQGDRGGGGGGEVWTGTRSLVGVVAAAAAAASHQSG